ncbi:MAG: hypothetical protein ABIF04_03540 [Chloroflexota bacterium]
MKISSETLNLLIGTGIGFLLSIVGTFFAHILEMRRNRQTRTWSLEDRNYEVRVQRKSKVEDYVNLLLEIASRIMNMSKAAFRVPPDATSFSKEQFEIDELFKQGLQLASNNVVFKDTQLSNDLSQIHALVGKEFTRVSLLFVNAKQSVPRDLQQELATLDVFYKQVKEIHSRIIQKLDEIA